MNAKTNELPQAVLDDDFREHKLNLWADTWPAGLPDEPWVEEWVKTRNYRWVLLENVLLEEGKIILRLNEFIQRDEHYIEGDVMMERANTLGNLAGQLLAQELLYKKHAIPKEWREFGLIFPGTVWRDDHLSDEWYASHSVLEDLPEPTFYIPCLYWGNDGWYLLFRRYCSPVRRLNCKFSSHYRLVRVVPSTNPA